MIHEGSHTNTPIQYKIHVIAILKPNPGSMSFSHCGFKVDYDLAKPNPIIGTPMVAALCAMKECRPSNQYLETPYLRHPDRHPNATKVNPHATSDLSLL